VGATPPAGVDTDPTSRCSSTFSDGAAARALAPVVLVAGVAGPGVETVTPGVMAPTDGVAPGVEPPTEPATAAAAADGVTGCCAGLCSIR
jgi:hypothetical protein